jgi:hypothetical protein
VLNTTSATTPLTTCELNEAINTPVSLWCSRHSAHG